jgi:hypothetical protein
MLYRALSLSFLLNTLLFAGDVPKPSHTVEMENKNPAKPVQGPPLEFQHPHTGNGGGGGGNSSSSVGSSAGGSVINLLSDLLRVEQPDIDKLRRDKQVADFHASLAKYGEHTTAQFFPDLYEKYMRTKNPMPMAFAEPSPLVVTPNSVTSVVKPAVTTPAPAPTPVAAPVVVAPTPTPVVPMPKFPAGSIKVPAIMTSGDPMLGGLQGSTSLVTPTVTGTGTGLPSFNILNNAGTKPLSPIFAPTFTPAAPPVPNGIQPPAGYVAPSGPSALEVAGAGAATVGMWGSIKGAAVAAAAAAKGAIVAATPYVVAVVTSPYVVVPVVVGGAGYGAYKLGQYHGNQRRIAHEMQEAVAKAARESSAHRQIHETVHTPTPQPTQPHVTPHSDLPPRLQPSDNPVKLGKKIYQPGPLDGQGDNPHGYKDQWGHYKYYTPENVAHAVESVQKGVYHGQNPKSGKHLFTYDCPKTGLQKWAETDNNGEIMNCGINEVRFTFCPKTHKLVAPTGFKKPKGKDTGWIDKSLKAGVIGSALSSQYSSSTILFPEMIEADLLPGDHYFLPPAPREITVHDLEAERMIKNHYVAMEQKKIEVIQNKINKGSNL